MILYWYLYSVLPVVVYLRNLLIFNLTPHRNLPITHKNTNMRTMYEKIEAVFIHEKVNEKVKPSQLHGIRRQMAESGHEDEHATLLGDEGLRTGGQALKLGYGISSSFHPPSSPIHLIHPTIPTIPPPNCISLHL